MRVILWRPQHVESHWFHHHTVNSLAPDICGCKLKIAFFKPLSMMNIWSISSDIALMWMLLKIVIFKLLSRINILSISSDITLIRELVLNATRPHWWWVNVGWQQAITWANVDLDLCRHMASLGHSELKLSFTKYHRCHLIFVTVDGRNVIRYAHWRHL